MLLNIAIGLGSEHDSKKLIEFVEGLEVRLRELYEDSAYDKEHIRRSLESMEIEANIPVNPRNGRKPKQYNVELYKKMKPAVERFFRWLKSFRRII